MRSRRNRVVHHQKLRKKRANLRTWQTKHWNPQWPAQLKWNSSVLVLFARFEFYFVIYNHLLLLWISVYNGGFLGQIPCLSPLNDFNPNDIKPSRIFSGEKNGLTSIEEKKSWSSLLIMLRNSQWSSMIFYICTKTLKHGRYDSNLIAPSVFHED